LQKDMVDRYDKTWAIDLKSGGSGLIGLDPFDPDPTAGVKRGGDGGKLGRRRVVAACRTWPNRPSGARFRARLVLGASARHGKLI
jgi:hypothetical protein